MATIQLPPDFSEFLKLLKVHEVRYLLIGGFAVNAYGYIRNTVDIDVWIASDLENQGRVLSAVREFGFASAHDGLLEGARAMLRLGMPPLRIEVMKAIAGVEFEDCWDRRVSLRLGDLEIPMISLPDLKANKRAAGRPKDLADLSELEVDFEA